MSLNGLDNAPIKEAHEAAIAEPGGWFLLKYASRDELEVLGRGHGGIVEIRNAIAQYEESSPLYGLLRYRRRSVMIKFLPEDCSRLLQARASVHFTTVCDRFAPYDSIFVIATSKELTDTKLSSACSLHTASGSTSSSTSSLRRRRLMEIAEEVEEDERERKRQSVVNEEESQEEAPPAADLPPVSDTKLNSELARSPEATQFSGGREPPEFGATEPPQSPTKSFDGGRRLSSQTARPDLYSYSSYPYSKPRVKLGPRPSLEANKRPHSSASTGPYRPISALPAGFKLFPKKSKSEDKHGNESEGLIKEEAETDSATPFTPVSTARASEDQVTRPHTSSGAHGSLTSTSQSPSSMAFPTPHTPAASKRSTMTPEKARLMKAMKLREKKMQKSSLVASDSPAQVSSATNGQDLEAEAPPAEEETTTKTNAVPDDHLSASKADSAIVLDAVNDQASVITVTDSHPASPVAASSDIDASTQASSLSELTDETLRPDEELKSHEEVDSEPQMPRVLSAVYEGDSLPESLSETTVQEARLKEPIEERPSDLAAVPEPDTTPLATDVSSASDSQDTQILDKTVETEEQPAMRSPVLPISKFAAASPQSTDGTEDKRLEDDEAESTQSPQAPPLHIPLSRFSTRDTNSPRSPQQQEIPSICTPTVEVEPATAEDDGSVHPDSLQDENASVDGDDEGEGVTEQKRPKRKTVEPIRTDITLPIDNDLDANLSDDDDLMDELQSATVEEAKPMMVSKSPVNPVFPGSSPLKRATTSYENNLSPSQGLTRTVSNPVHTGFLAPGDVPTNSARSVSSGATFLNKTGSRPSSPNVQPKSTKLGSSISQRIKALERVSSISSAHGDRKERPSSAFFSVRPTSIREPSRSPSVVDRTSSLTGAAPTASLEFSRDSSPEASKLAVPRDRSGSISNRLSMFEGGSLPRGRPDFVQVTARIIREPGQQFPKAPDYKTDNAEYAPLDLKNSPLVVDHRKNPHQEPPQPKQEGKMSLLQRRFSKSRRSLSRDRDDAPEPRKEDSDEPRPRRRSSLTIVKDFINDRRGSVLSAKSSSTDNLHLSINPPPGSLASPAPTATPSRSPARPPSAHHNSIIPRRLSISSRRSSLDQKSPAPPTTNPFGDGLSPSLMSEMSNDSDGETKNADRKGSSGSTKSNRATRFMRRLSNSLSSSRKNSIPAISPTVAEENAAEVEAATRGLPPSRSSTVGPGLVQSSLVSYLGDVNVQFPDTLLWKRRTLGLDGQGFLILSAVQGITTAVPAIKRFHMSDFKAPYIPEMEAQELPNSVVLDFIDGSGIQIACEDRAGQFNALHVLEDAHRTHTSFGL